MGRVYQMPPDTREKEKIVAGLFDVSQVIWFGLGVGLGILTVFITYILTELLILGIILAIPLVVLGCIFALKKKEGLPLFTYLRLKHKFKNKIKFYVNAGVQEKLRFNEGGED